MATETCGDLSSVGTRDRELAVAPVFVAMILSGNHKGKNGKIT